MFVQTPTQFYILRFLLGIAEAGFYPGALLFLTYWFPSHLRSQAVAIMLLGNTLSAIIGAPLSGAIMRFLDGWGGLAGWRWVFAIEGLPATLLGIFFLIVLRNGPRDASWLTDKEKALVTADLEAERTSQVAAGVRHRFIDAFRNSNIWGVVLANFCNLSTIYGIQFWLPTIVQRLNGTSVFNTGLIIAGLTLIPSAVLILNARHSDRKRERRWHATAGFALSALGLSMAGLWSNNAWLALTGLVLAHSGALIVSGTIFSLPATFVTGAAAAAGFALITTVGNLSGYTTPFLFGVLRDATGNFSAGFFGMSLLSAIGAAAILLIPALRRKAAGASAGPVQDQHAA
jgi:MFS family permease